jgi:hypothetical protein
MSRTQLLITVVLLAWLLLLVHALELGNPPWPVPEPWHRGSFASSQAKMAGSFLYWTPVSELVRLSSVRAKFWYQPRIVASV